MRVVDGSDWLSEWSAAHERGLTYFDFLTAVDRGDTIEVIAHAVDPDSIERIMLGAQIPAGSPRLDTVSAIYPGASWHERETAEMFGVHFVGLVDARRLLLRTSFGAPPMRKSTVLAARVAVEWPGIAEPGGTAVRRRQRPPGVADDWLEDKP